MLESPMTYNVALDPELGISAEQFVEAWQNDPEASTLAKASAATSITHYGESLF